MIILFFLLSSNPGKNNKFYFDLAWRNLENPDANCSIPEFILIIAKLKGNLKETLENESRDARIGTEHELTETPQLIAPGKCRIEYCFRS